MKTDSPIPYRTMRLYSWAKAHGVEREEVYQSDAPAHWPKDRCMMLESEEQFLRRVEGLMKKATL